jgi:hypothetical protein
VGQRFLVVSVILLLLGASVLAVGTWGRGGDAVVAQRPGSSSGEWRTDFQKFSVALSEIQSGGPPKDGIPALDRPRFETVADAARWLKAVEPVIFFERSGDARAYPLQILIWHEIVNDTVGGGPVTVTFCPLCNTSLVYDRRLLGRTHDFGTTGKLYKSALVMYDRQTESWWWQVSGEAIVGEMTGARLSVLSAQIVSFDAFRHAYPQGKVLSRETGFSRAYGQNPYQGYDNINASPFLYAGPQDSRLRPMERVVTVSIGKEDVAYPFSVLEKIGVVHDEVGGEPIVVFHQRGTASALDQGVIATSRDIGAAAVFSRVVGAKTLTFEVKAGQWIDTQTRSTWNLLGTATGGALESKRLGRVAHGNHFWFAWAAYKPKTRIYAL